MAMVGDRVNARILAPSAQREHDALRIEEAGLNALQTQRQLFYDGWLLRVSSGKAKRARSVNPHFGSTLPLPEKIEHCEAVYRRYELPPLFRITPFVKPSSLVPTLVGGGYVAFDETLVQSLSLDTPPEGVGRVVEDVTVTDLSPREFAQAAGALRGSSPAQCDAHRERLESSPLESRLVGVVVDGEIRCTAQMAAEDDMAGLFDVVTAAQAQGRGYATLAVDALLAWAWDRATRLVYLQVTGSNAPALAVYRKFGFETLYTYHYLARPEDTE